MLGELVQGMMLLIDDRTDGLGTVCIHHLHQGRGHCEGRRRWQPRSQQINNHRHRPSPGRGQLESPHGLCWQSRPRLPVFQPSRKFSLGKTGLLGGKLIFEGSRCRGVSGMPGCWLALYLEDRRACHCRLHHRLS